MSAVVKEAAPADAERWVGLKALLDRETHLMLLEPNERDTDVAIVQAQLERTSASSNSVVLVAEDNDQLVGYVELEGGPFQRNRGTATLVIGVLESASGRGLGTRLLGEAERWARAHGLHRLELTVMEHNDRAAALYQRMGYEIEGRRRECLLVDGRLIDEFYMAKLLADL